MTEAPDMKLETFFENFDLLTDAPNAANRLREIVLGLACSGKITEHWRRTNPSDSSGKQLLEKI
jgi:type I restriction enzyme S subunit